MTSGLNALRFCFYNALLCDFNAILASGSFTFSHFGALYMVWDWSYLCSFRFALKVTFFIGRGCVS